MKYIKYINLILFIVLGILTGCSKTNEEVISDTTYEEKLITGIAPVFDESLGYYNENPSVVRVSENLQYVYYTRNEIKYDSNSDSIAVRKAENVNGKWVYGNYKTILRPSNNSWDSLSVSSQM